VLKLELLDSASEVLYAPANFRVDLSCDARGDLDQPCPVRVLRQTANSVMVNV